MGINKVDQKSFRYKLLWNTIKFWHELYYHQKIEITNQDRVPAEGAIVFTPNHQNALMDALALLFSVKRTVVFLARADIFKKKSVAEILYFLRILPVYRPRDGQGEVKKNLETFKKTSEVLQKNLGITIFPEGTHTDKQSLLPLKKGFAKIAMQTEEANDFKLGIQLIPVGISYSNYTQCQSTLSINFGHPIHLADYYEEYKKKPAIALNQIRDKMSESLKENMIHIEDDENYNAVEYLMTAYAKEIPFPQKGTSRILVGQVFLNKLESLSESQSEKFEELIKNTNDFLKLSSKFNKRQKALWPKYSITKLLLNTLRFIILLPLLLPSALLHLPTQLLSHLPSKFIGDEQFHSTFRFVLAFIILPITFTIEAILLNIFYDDFSLFYFFIAYSISLIFILLNVNWLRNYYGIFKIFIFKMFNSKKAEGIEKLINSIKLLIQEL
ncbi:MULTISPECIES: 1-acyl-sn-glycerol-3-phosphate acyltransferase [unclassified Lentimicrobium]|uniref:1-acyl-sn-glycerol-3-phosphate acyltransferase n=1 Tax=unclassified Lentimicrobium TaxID=2677434 RepID=UPI001554C27B|nr:MULTISPECIES: 1-acyl-sn-glycerol-3-phosphate acyltransferase [unclassified Lentimicrobium]NPD45649.1 hypothetical protein [Lentimicrobium sp. S6]NPD86416.1 hypothetical protein [Lentimicrobium sp. L6]